MNSELETRLAQIDKKLGYILGNQVALLEWQEKHDRRRRSHLHTIKSIRHAMYFAIGSFSFLTLLLFLSQK